MKATGKPELRVKILSPTGTHFEGRAVSVSAINRVGPFDILANHANFFSLLTAGTIKVRTTEDETLDFPITHGIAKCNSNNVTLFLDIETT